MDFSTAYFHNIQYTEVSSDQQELYRCFHSARLESLYWNSVSTFGGLLHFQDHSCEEIVYFSKYFSTAFFQNIHCTEVTSDQQELYQCFQCARLESSNWNLVSTVEALLQFQYHSCEEIVYFSRDFSSTFIQYIEHTEVTVNQLKSYTDALIVQDWNRCTEVQYPLLGHFFTFNITAVMRLSTFQWILVQHSFRILNIPKSHRTNRCYTNAFIVQDLNRSTEIQYLLFGHLFTFNNTAVKR